MSEFSASNKRVAKNTLFLYAWMFITIIVNLYTVRVIWKVLGVDNYGIYNVVGGIVLMFSFLNSAMIASSQRFIAFEIGTGNMEKLRRVFSISLTVHIILSLLILFLAETVGLWFLNTKLNIPTDRMYAANWCYQCSVIAFIINVISVPYNACIVAHEHMKQYGYFGILEVFLKLGIVFLLIIIPFDKLISYSALVVCVYAVMRIIYGVYCKKHFEECSYHFVNDRKLLGDIFSFAGWSFLGNLGFSVRDQGLNIVLNLFFNVAVNAAKGIVNQISNTVNGFASNFQMALNPQITKRYAAGEIDSMMKLVFAGCKYSAILMLFIVIPLFFANEQVLKLWLGEIAPYTTGFLQLMLIMILIDSMVSPITTAIQATGHIKWFQIIISIIMLSNIPLAWMLLKIEANPYVVVYVSIFTSVIALTTRLILLHKLVEFSYVQFVTKVFVRIIALTAVTALITWWLYSVFPLTFIGLIGFVSSSLIIIAAMSYLIGLEPSERIVIVGIITKRLRKTYK